LRTFRAVLHGELDPLAFIQVAKALALDGRIVYEDIRAILSLDEAIAFGATEPLDSSGLTLAHMPFSSFP